MLGFGPFCLDLGHIAWIWAIWQNLGQNRPQRRRSPEDGAGGGDGRTDVRTYGRTDSPGVLQDFVPFGAAAQMGGPQARIWVLKPDIGQIWAILFGFGPLCLDLGHFA